MTQLQHGASQHPQRLVCCLWLLLVDAGQLAVTATDDASCPRKCICTLDVTTLHGTRRLAISCLWKRGVITQSLWQSYANVANNVTSLSLSNVMISKIPPIFGNLLELDIRHSKFKTPIWRSLSRFRQLSSLILIDNNISEIPGDALYQNPKLKVVNLSQNQITDIKPGTFSAPETDGLVLLNISHNLLRTIDSWMLGLPCLWGVLTIDVSYNRIDHFGNNTELNSVASDNVSDTGSIYIKARGNRLHSAATMNLKLLQNLLLENEHRYFKIAIDIQENPLRCDCEMYKWSHLLEHLQNNTRYVYRYPENVLSGPKVDSVLSTLKQTSNQQREIRGKMPEEGTNQLVCWEPRHLQSRPLRSLTLDALACSHSEMFGCPDKCKCSFNELQDTYHVNCSKVRYMTELPLKLRKAAHIELILSDTSISKLTRRDYLKNLTVINLSYCQLKELDLAVFLFARALQKVLVAGNQIRHIRAAAILHLLKDLKLFDINDNQLNCDCKLLGFQSWLIKNRDIVPHCDHIFCDAPYQLAGKAPLIELPPDDLVCQTYPFFFLVAYNGCFFIIISLVCVVKMNWLRFQIFLFDFSKPSLKLNTTGLEFLETKQDIYIMARKSDAKIAYNLENIMHNFIPTLIIRQFLNGDFGSCVLDHANELIYSRLVIFIISSDMLQDNYSLFVFKETIYNFIRHPRFRLLLIARENPRDMFATFSVDKDIYRFMKYYTFLVWDDNVSSMQIKLQRVLNQLLPLPDIPATKNSVCSNSSSEIDEKILSQDSTLGSLAHSQQALLLQVQDAT